MLTRENIFLSAKGVAKAVTNNAHREGDKTNYLAYQLPVISKIGAKIYSVLKMPRQTGKTWIASFIAIGYLLAGIDVLVCYPTLQQGWKQLLSKIAIILQSFGVVLLKSNQSGIVLANNATVHVVSTSDITKSARGFTVGIVIIDEGQDAPASALGRLLPSIKKYLRQELATVLIMGTGGFRSSLLEVAWRERGFQLVHVKPEKIIKVDPKYAIINTNDKKTLSAQEYRTEVNCELSTGGNASVLKHLDIPLPQEYAQSCVYTSSIGIDVGQMQDNTVVTHIKKHLGSVVHYEVAEILQLSCTYDQQCAIIKDWVVQRNLQTALISVEVNGVGRPIFDYLKSTNKKDTTPLIKVFPFTCTAKSKHGLVQKLQSLDYTKRIHYTDRRMADALAGLCEYYTEDGKWSVDHSDYLSSLMVAIARI